jgi:Ca-activated chloride channel family protein
MTRRTICLFILILALTAIPSHFLLGQQPSTSIDSGDKPKQGFKIGVEVNMVNVPISVRQPEGGFIKGLPQSSFHVFEDGKPQEILFFAQEGLPTRIAIVLDSSESVRSEWGTIKYATKRFVEHLKPEDQFSIIGFNTEIRLKMDWGSKTERVDPVLGSIYCKDRTKLWDAVWITCNDVFKDIVGKKAMIIMTDGMDNESSVSYDEALQAAIPSEVAIYIVSKTEALRQLMVYEKYDIPQKEFANADLALQKLAYETGGRVLYPNNFGQLDNIYAQVDEELRNQYTIGYISTNTAKDGSYRRINVGVAIKNATVTARPGYYAPEK